jgi:hypothetical protein
MQSSREWQLIVRQIGSSIAENPASSLIVKHIPEEGSGQFRFLLKEVIGSGEYNILVSLICL